MTPVIPLADPLPQPAPAWLLWALLQLTFFLHLLAMNVVLGGSILALHWRLSRRTDSATPRAEVVAAFARALPVAVAAAVTFGVAPLLFVQVLYGRVFFTSSILMAWWWLAVVPLVVFAYSGAYLLGISVGGSDPVSQMNSLADATSSYADTDGDGRADDGDLPRRAGAPGRGYLHPRGLLRHAAGLCGRSVGPV